MTGYHFTSWRNWESIKKHGLRPNEVRRTELLEHFDYYPKGIWLWEKEPPKVSELGSVIYHLADKGQTKVVKLAVEYDDDDLLYMDSNLGRRLVRLFHDGSVGDWSYHSRQEAIIVIKPIPLSKIKLLKTYNLMNIVEDTDSGF